MTSDGISAEDWDRVHDLAVDVVNCADDSVAWTAARRAMRDYLRELHDKYGDRPSLWATEADYADSPHETEELFLKAFDLAVRIEDEKNQKAIALSLAGMYATDLMDVDTARMWLDVERQWPLTSDLSRSPPTSDL